MGNAFRRAALSMMAVMGTALVAGATLPAHQLAGRTGLAALAVLCIVVMFTAYRVLLAQGGVTAMSAGRLAVARLGVVAYPDALERQRALAEDRIAGRLATDALLLLEHPGVVTLGRGTRATSLPIAPELLKRRGIDVFEIERGGDVTYHGPGQLVGYPIFDLTGHRKDLHWYLRQIEEALIVALARFGIVGERRRELHRRVDRRDGRSRASGFTYASG